MMGTMYLTYDLNVCISNQNDARSVIISEDIEANSLMGVVGGSVLMPPYNSMMYLVDGNMKEFQLSYEMYLSSVVTDKMIILLIQALLQGINLILYFDKDAKDTFVSSLILYMNHMYGITIGTESTPFSYNPQYDEIIVSKLYLYGNISAQEYFVMYPYGGYIQDPMIINRLICDVKPNIITNNLEDYIRYYNDLKDRIKHNGNMFIAPAIRREK